MPKALNYSQNQSDLDLIGTALNKEIAYCTDDYWEIVSVRNLSDYISTYSSDADGVDISYYDITEKDSGKAIEALRNDSRKSMLVIVSDDSVSPLTYMTPRIMPSSLLLKPLTEEDVSKCSKELLNVFYKESGEAAEKKFCINSKSEKVLVPLRKVLYFEAREKKIFLNTQSGEIGFYSTLDVIFEELPANFIRCHRGFIVNIDKVTKIDSSLGVLYLGDDIVVPFSRGYKSSIVKAMESVSYG